jgi:hypothetical protein
MITIFLPYTHIIFMNKAHSNRYMITVTTQTTPTPEQVVTVQPVATAASPVVQGEKPQTVYEKKKGIFRFSQIIWYVLGVVEVLLAFRFVFKVLGANPGTGFTNFIYSVTGTMVLPFRGIFPTPATGGSVLEWSTVIAGFVYLCLAWGIVYFLDLVYPITPEDVGV